MNHTAQILDEQDPRWPVVRTAALLPASRLAAAYVRAGRGGYAPSSFYTEFSQFLAEGMASGDMGPHKAALEGAVEMACARMENDQPSYGTIASVLHEAREQVGWALNLPAPQPQPMHPHEWSLARAKTDNSGVAKPPAPSNLNKPGY